MSETRARRSRSGGGAARRAERTAVSVETKRYIERNIPLYEFLDEATLEIIEYNAETVLEEIGVNFVDSPEALERWRSVGATIEGERVRIPRGLARELCKTAPSKFVQHARNPERSVEIGGKTLVTAPVYGPPFVRDRDGGRRYATLADFQKFVKLGYMSKYLHHSGGTVCEPTDVPVNKRHLDMLLTHMVYSDKPFMGSVTEPSRAQDSVEMCEILFGKEFVQNNTVMTSLININSPLTFDSIMMGALEVFASNNQASIITEEAITDDLQSLPGAAKPPADLRDSTRQTPQRNDETISGLGKTKTDGIHILLVDDHADIRFIAKTYLELAGHQVFEAANPDDAMAWIRSDDVTIQLVLTDLALPDLNDGLGLIDFCRETYPNLKLGLDYNMPT